MLPVIIALIGLFVFFLVISVLRLREAIRIQAADEFNILGHDVTVEAINVRLKQMSQPKAASSSNLAPQAAESAPKMYQAEDSPKP